MQGNSFEELAEKQQTIAPANPSAFVENINPLVEQTIKRCLEKKSGERPKSALQVALALPGGNPIEAAIAIGETPNPEIIIAPEKDALNQKSALEMLLIFFVSFIFMFALLSLVTLTKRKI